MLTAQMLRKGLKTRRFGSKVFCFEVIDSTNACARALASCWADEGTVIVAEQQTAGRGRMGRTWVANPFENLTFSVILRPDTPAEGINLLPLYAGVAVAEAIERATGLSVVCKWPNDLLVNDKKVAGILIEGSLKESSVEYVVIGIGINVNQREFPPEISSTATSLIIEGGKEYSREDLFREVMRSMEAHYKGLTSHGFQRIIPKWIDRSAMIGRRISVNQNGSILTGTVKGVNEQGALLLDVDGTQTTLHAGDVTILGTNGR